MSFALLAQAGRLMIQLATTMALARLLAPESFGLAAIVTPFVGLLIMLADPGISTALVQRPELGPRLRREVFGFQIHLGLGLLAAAWSAGLLGRALLGGARIWDLAFLGGVAAMGECVALVPRALLQRERRFAELAVLETAALAAASIAGVVSARLIPGPAVLLALPAAQAWLAAAAGARICRLAPARADLRAVWRALDLARHVALSNALRYFAGRADRPLVAWGWGPTAAGLYSKPAQMMTELLAQTLTAPATVALPLLSRSRTDAATFGLAVRLAAYPALPVATCIALLAPQIVALVLGSQWLDSAPLLRAFALAACFQPAIHARRWLLVARADVVGLRRWSAAEALAGVGSVALFLPLGLLPAASAYAVSAAALALVALLLGPRPAWPDIGRPVAVAATAGAAIAAANAALGAWGPLASVFLPLSLALVLVGCLAAAWPSVRRDLASILRAS